MLTGLLGVSALGMDVSMMVAARQRAQSIADAAAMAAARALPSTSAATAAADSVIAANNATGAGFIRTGISFPTTVTLDDGTTQTVASGQAVIVSGYVNAPMTFSPVVGYQPTSVDGRANTLSVSASTTMAFAGISSLPPGSPLAPVAVVADDCSSSGSNGSCNGNEDDSCSEDANRGNSHNDCGQDNNGCDGQDAGNDEGCAPSSSSLSCMGKLLSSTSGSQTPRPNAYQPQSCQVTLKSGQWKSDSLDSSGNCGAVDTGIGNGANAYRDALAGVSTQRCSVGDTLTTKPGNMCGPTRQGVTNRLTGVNPAFTHNFSCYTDWFFGRSTYAVDTTMPCVADGANIYFYRKDPHRQELTDAHVMIVPLVDTPSKNGRSACKVLGFAAFFAEQTPSDGSNAAITGRFIGIVMKNAIGGGCPSGGAYTTRMVH